ncbi:dienelactone hydrolase family protein [Herbiconiux liangxiaofengii]|uniref:dienelactone hydrolase family protein n=1 Tax=Herbiconiux liangxiaofengii TaxID=3342795 RepID=UPI0035B7C61B
MPEFIEIPSPGWPLQFGEPGRPGIVIVHDAYGRLPYLEAYGRALAGQGFFVVLPDLFGGVATVDEAGAAELQAALDPGFAMAALDDAVALARTPDGPAPDSAGPAGDSVRVGLIGLGLGGRFALRVAQSGAADAVVAYYALLGDDEGGVIPCSVLLHRSDDGDWTGGVDPDDFVGRLKEHGTPVTQHRYAAREGFANATLLDLLDKNAAALAFARSTYFLQAQLLD